MEIAKDYHESLKTQTGRLVFCPSPPKESTKTEDEPEALPSNTSIISNVCRFSLPSVLTSETARAKRRREEAAARASEEDARKQAEVLRAAKALFSKRTRTLYHWMYPDAPKQQLKMIIADSWEATGAEEKEFYVSQVLGRFGFTPWHPMVNPQLDVIRKVSMSESAKAAVSGMLSKDSRTRRRRRCKRKRDASQEMANGFQDDPELNRELQQFTWASRMNSV